MIATCPGPRPFPVNKARQPCADARFGCLTRRRAELTFTAMTTTVTAKGTVVLPRKVLRQQKVRAGDKFEVLAVPDEPGVIELRRVRRKPNEGLVALLRACPVKGFRIPERSKELPRPAIEL